MACCASTSPRARTCRGGASRTSTRSPPHSTADLVRPSTGGPPPKPSPSGYRPSNKPVSLPPVESGLRSAVGVHDGSGGPALPLGHLQSVDDELGADVVRDRPPDDPPGPDVDDRGAVHLPLGGGVFGDVGAPQPVRAVGDEPPADQVLVGGGQRPVSAGGTPRPARPWPSTGRSACARRPPRHPTAGRHGSAGHRRSAGIARGRPGPARAAPCHGLPAPRAGDARRRSRWRVAARAPGEVTATGNPSPASSRTSRALILGGRSRGRTTPRPA